jgi:O-antigen polysaccharide polymerase Wzy
MSIFVLSRNLNSIRTRPVLLYAGVPFLVTAFLWATGSKELSISEILAGFILSWIPWASYQEWYRGSRQDLPLFSLVAAMYWVAYAVPLFWSSHVIGLVNGNHRLSERAIAQSMYLVVSGVLALWTGMKITAKWCQASSTRVDVPENPWRWQYLRIVLIATVLMKIVVPITAWGESARQIVVNIETFVASIVFVILLRSWLRGEAVKVDKVLVTGYLLAALVVGLASGWLGTFVGLGIICVAAYLYEKHKLPVTALLVVLPIVMFLQPGKAKFREVYWKGGPKESYSSGYAERITFWIEASSQAWGRALTDPTGAQGFPVLAGATVNRLSLLEQTANVIEMTPAQVPYQYGRLYSYLPITFVPRVLWPEKPSITDANKWYQLAYHLTAPANIESVGISVGTLAESYISFGWIGPVIVMFCLGVLLGVVKNLFMHTASGLLFSSIGVSLLPGLLAVESQMAVYVAGLLQQVFFALLTLAPVITVSRRDSCISGTALSRARVISR